MSAVGDQQGTDLRDFRKLLQDCETKGWTRFDDLVFKIAAGGLALSMTLLGLLRESLPAGLVWMFTAWALWGATLLALLVSVLTGQFGLRAQIAHLDAGTYYSVKQPEGRLGALTPWLNYAATAACGLALFSLLVFAVVNLSGARSMTQRQSQESKGMVAPQAPVQQATQSSDSRGQVTPQAPPPTSNTITVPGGAGQVAPQAPPPSAPPPAKE
jgi:hypothetical protein